MTIKAALLAATIAATVTPAISSDYVAVWKDEKAVVDGYQIAQVQKLDPALLAPLLACFVSDETKIITLREITLDRRFTYVKSVEVIVGDGPDKGCRGIVLTLMK